MDDNKTDLDVVGMDRSTHPTQPKDYEMMFSSLTRIVTLFMLAILLQFTTANADEPAVKAPLKVFILAGQSNMEGHAEIRTFDYIGKDPATAPLLKEMRN
ncbi:MAG: hypothetical protein JNK90_09085, partial [Planctomycetaceae bacterium]|nr:hypothetical protein [Planctomycetaceae bacterium]